MKMKMKKLRLSLSFLLLIGLFAIVSCDKDEPPIEEKPSILGTWVLTNFSQEEFPNPDFNFSKNCTVDCDELSFSKTGINLNGDATFTYLISDNVITMKRISDNEITVSRFTLTENTLIITTEGAGMEGGITIKSYARK